jgi:hypothetical protein
MQQPAMSPHSHTARRDAWSGGVMVFAINLGVVIGIELMIGITAAWELLSLVTLGGTAVGTLYFVARTDTRHFGIGGLVGYGASLLGIFSYLGYVASVIGD